MILSGRKLIPILLIAVMLLSLSTLGSIPGTPTTSVNAANVLSDFTDPPGAEWGRLFLDLTYDATAYSIAQTPDGYIVAGTVIGPDSSDLPDYWATLVEMDLDGNIGDWAEYYAAADDPHTAAYSVIPNYTDHDEDPGTPDIVDGYVITGTKHKQYGPYYAPDVWIMKTYNSPDTDGDGILDKQWEHQFGQEYTDQGNYIIPDGSDNWVIGGWRNLGDPTNEGYMLRTDGTETPVWEAIYDVDNESTWWLLDEIHCVEKTSGGFILGTSDGMVKVTDGSPPAEVWRAGAGARYYSVKETSDGGFVGTGTIDTGDSYDIILTIVDSNGQNPSTHIYGLDASVLGLPLPDDFHPYEAGRSVVQTSDDGYIIAGIMTSYADQSGDTWFYGHGGTDVWLIKTDPTGAIEWDIALGGEGNDAAYDVLQTGTGSFLVVGSATYEGTSRMWMVNVTGDFQAPVPSFSYSPISPVYVSEQVTFDASASSDPDDDIADPEDGIVAYEWDFGDGHSHSSSEATAQHIYRIPGDYTATLYVTDSDGITRFTSQTVTVIGLSTQWESFIGGAYNDVGNSITEAWDGGYIIAGYKTWSTSGKPDAWLVKVDHNGDMVWQHSYADTINGVAHLTQNFDSVARTLYDGGQQGYIMVGNTQRNVSTDLSDLWLMKTDIDGNPLTGWPKTIERDFNQEGHCVAPTSDGGYIITGKNMLTAGPGELWLVKTDSNGDVEWDYVYGPDDEFVEGFLVIQTADGGYAVAGERDNHNIMLIKTNELGTEQWTTEWYSTSGYTWGRWVGETPDGGFVVAGSYDNHVSLMKADSDGYKDWAHVIGTSYWDQGFSGAQAPDGGYVVVGTMWPSSPYEDDIYVVKADSAGNYEWEMSFGTPELTEEGNSVLPLSDGSYIIMGSYPVTPSYQLNLWLIKVGPDLPPGVHSLSEAVTIESSMVTDDPETYPYDPEDVPEGINWDNARGFSISASGTDGTYRFRIAFPSPIDSDFTLYKLPDWIVIPYIPIDEHTIEVELDIVGGVLDPDFVAASASPYTSGHDPADGATDIAVDSNIVVHIRDDGDGVDDTTIVMTVEGVAVSPTITGTAADLTLTYTPPVDFDYLQVVDVTVDASDLAGNPMTTDSYSFTTEAEPDTTAPYTSGHAPADGATDIAIDSSIVVHVQDEGDGVDQATIIMTVGGVTVTPTITGTAADYTLTYTPPADFDYLQVVDVTVDASDLSGNPMTADSYSFTTIGEISDNQPPNQPTNITPADGATGSSLTMSLSSSSFLDPDAGDTHAASQWQITTTAGDYSSPVFDSGIDTTNLTSIAMPIADLDYSTTYYWRVRHQDNQGAWSDYSTETSFTTVEDPGDEERGAAGDCGCGGTEGQMAKGELLIGWGIVGLCWGGGYYLVRRVTKHRRQ